VCALALALLLVGCGGAGHLDSRGATLLDAQIGAARQAAAQGDIVRAGVLVQAAEDTVNSLRARHWIDDRRAASILAAIGDTQDALRAYAATSTTTATNPTTTTTVAPPPPASPAPPKQHGHHKRKDT
jgi:hypothetical protein